MEKIAVIDLGSNSARLVLANIMDGGYFEVFDEWKESVRLGQDMERDGFLKPARVSEAIRTLKMFRRLCDVNKVDRIIAVATAAVRKAKNQKSFLDEVQITCGIKFQVLSAEEEALKIYHGVINSLDVPKGVIVNIGGGTTQLIHYNRRNILNMEMLNFGALTISELFDDSSYSPQEQCDKMEEFFRMELARVEWLKDVEPDYQFVGVGGSFRNIGRIVRKISNYPLDMAHNFNISKESFLDIYETIRNLDVEKRKRIKGLSSARADIFGGAVAMVKAFFDCTEFNKMVISGAGLREGILFNHALPYTLEKPISDVLGHSLATKVKYFDENIQHADHVCDLSMQLFKNLRVLHKLPRCYVRVLRTAAVLHDSGIRLKFYDHHKHSCYFILNANIYGISHKDIVLAAFVASCGKNEDLNYNEIMKYKDLISAEDVEAVRRLGVILNIAECLDRSMSGLVKSLNCDVLGDSVIMKTETTGDATLEINDALSCSSQFKKIYKKNLEIL